MLVDRSWLPLEGESWLDCRREVLSLEVVWEACESSPVTSGRAISEGAGAWTRNLRLLTRRNERGSDACPVRVPISHPASHRKAQQF